MPGDCDAIVVIPVYGRMHMQCSNTDTNEPDSVDMIEGAYLLGPNYSRTVLQGIGAFLYFFRLNRKKPQSILNLARRAGLYSYQPLE